MQADNAIQDCSAEMDQWENPPLCTVSDSQWELIEHLASLAGEAGRASGRIEQWQTASVDRMVELCEWPGAAVQILVDHLRLLRRDDLRDALLFADDDREFLADLLTEAGRIDDARTALARRFAPVKPRAPRGPRAPGVNKGGRPARVPGSDGQPVDPHIARWEACKADPMAAIKAVVGIHSSTSGTPRQRTLSAGRYLGIRVHQRLPGSNQQLTTAELRAEVDQRLMELEDLATSITTGPGIEPEPPTVVITTGEAPGPQDASLTVPVADPLSHEALIAEAWEARTGPTTLQAIERWRARLAYWNGDWRESFRVVSDWLGPSAAAAIAHATGESFEVVAAHGQALLAEHERLLNLYRLAYTDAAELTDDAASAGGWAWLASCQRTTVQVLQARARELTTDPRQAA